MGTNRISFVTSYLQVTLPCSGGIFYVKKEADIFKASHNLANH